MAEATVHVAPFSRSMIKKKNLPALSTPCHFCHTTLQGMKKCASCKLVYYCSKDCQAAHWNVHKERCRFVAENADAAKSARTLRSTLERLITSQFSQCLALAQGRPGVFVLALQRQASSAIVFQFHTPAELAVKRGLGWDHLREVVQSVDVARTVVGAMVDPDGELVAIANISSQISSQIK